MFKKDGLRQSPSFVRKMKSSVKQVGRTQPPENSNSNTEETVRLSMTLTSRPPASPSHSVRAPPSRLGSFSSPGPPLGWPHTYLLLPHSPEALTLKFNSHRQVGVSDSAVHGHHSWPRIFVAGTHMQATGQGGGGGSAGGCWAPEAQDTRAVLKGVPFWPWGPQAKDTLVWTWRLHRAIGVWGESHVSQMLIYGLSSEHQGHCCPGAYALAGPLPPPRSWAVSPRSRAVVRPAFRAKLTAQLLRDLV